MRMNMEYNDPFSKLPPGGIAIFDVSDPEFPSIRGQAPGFGDSYDLLVSGSTVITALAPDQLSPELEASTV